MQQRVTDSNIVFAATQTDATATTQLSVTDLTKIVPASGRVGLSAVSLKAGETVPADLKIKEVILGPVEPGWSVRMYYSTIGGSALADVMAGFAPDLLRPDPVALGKYAPDHGLELTFKYDNGTTALSTSLIWYLSNQDPAEYALIANLISKAIQTGPFSPPIASGLGGLSGLQQQWLATQGGGPAGVDPQAPL